MWLFVASVPTCLKHVTGIKFRISTYLQKSIKLVRLNIYHIVLAVFLVEFMSNYTNYTKI